MIIYINLNIYFTIIKSIIKCIIQRKNQRKIKTNFILIQFNQLLLSSNNKYIIVIYINYVSIIFFINLNLKLKINYSLIILI